jgi:hypothetical protein
MRCALPQLAGTIDRGLGSKMRIAKHKFLLSKCELPDVEGLRVRVDSARTIVV